MHLARTRPREDALMILALDDDVTAEVEAEIRSDDAVVPRQGRYEREHRGVRRAQAVHEHHGRRVVRA